MPEAADTNYAAARLSDCERAMRATASIGRHVVRAGAFEVFLAAPGASRFLSLAVPAGDPRPKDVRALERVFDAASTPLRIEYFAERHPRLAELLLEEGLSCGRRDPVMVVEPAWIVQSDPIAGFDYEQPGADSRAIDELLAAQSRAFGMTGSADGWAEIVREGIRAGVFLAGLVRAPKGVVASAALLLGDGRVAELAGVGTVPEYRGRGLAGLVSGLLIASGFRDGVELAWLSADSSAVSVYERLGFRTIGTQLNFEADPR
jgi:ribosomal protein S18 acetylase RimI-like enzyme